LFHDGLNGLGRCSPQCSNRPAVRKITLIIHQKHLPSQGTAGSGELHDGLSSSLRLSLEEEMRPLKRCDLHLRFDSSNVFQTRCTHKAISFRLEVQDGHSNLVQVCPRLAVEHRPESSFQHFRLNR
jgi:hypothetical protein